MSKPVTYTFKIKHTIIIMKSLSLYDPNSFKQNIQIIRMQLLKIKGCVVKRETNWKGVGK